MSNPAAERKMSEHTAGPWFVGDFRASEMRRLGWTGPAIDRILITNKTGPEIEACSGANSVIARIQFDNRTEPLGENNIADAYLIAAAPDLLKALDDIAFQKTTEELEADGNEGGDLEYAYNTIVKRARAAIALAKSGAA